MGASEPKTKLTDREIRADQSENQRLVSEVQVERERVEHLKRIRKSLSVILQEVPKTAYGLFSTFKDIKNPVLYVNEKCHVIWANDAMILLLTSCRKQDVILDDIIGSALCEVVRDTPCKYINTAIEERECMVMRTIFEKEIKTNIDGATPTGCKKVYEICYMPVYNGYSGCFIIYQNAKAGVADVR